MKSQLAGKISISVPIFSIVHTYLDIYSYQPEKNINEKSLPTARTTLIQFGNTMMYKDLKSLDLRSGRSYAMNFKIKLRK